MTRKTNITLPARLYHGTSTACRDSILDEGIRPRPDDSLGCWPSAVSMEGHTYLTRAHALHFAAAAVGQGYRQDVTGQLLILEVDCRDLDTSLVRPDEDYLTQMRQLTRSGQPSEYDATARQVPHLWSQSLARLGNVAFAGTVPPEAIIRYVVVEDLYNVVRDYYSVRGDRNIHVFPNCKRELIKSLEFLFCRKMHTDFGAGLSKAKLRAMYPHLSRDEIVNFGYLAECLWMGYPRCRRAARKRVARCKASVGPGGLSVFG